MTILNGTSKSATLSVKRYQEVIGNVKRAKDILTGRYVDLSNDVVMKPRQSFILEFTEE